MAIGVDVIKTTGRLIFDLERNGEKTTRSLDIANPVTDTASLQTAVNDANALFTSASMNVFMQPATWRDFNITEEQWTTTKVSYEIVTTATTPIEPDEVLDRRSDEAQAEERSHENEGQPQGEWNG